MAVTKNQQPTWKVFEAQVKSALEALGYCVHSDQLMAGTQVDLYAELKGDLFINRFVVECKSSATYVGVEEVRQLSAFADALSNRTRPLFGLLVAATGFTKTAKQFAEQAGIKLMTLSELLALSFDPEPIATHTIRRFESDDLEGTYVALSCQVKEETGGTIYKPVERFLDTFLATTQRPGAAVLGNFGTGKTSLCKHYAYLLAKRWVSGVRKFLPIFVTLRDIRDLMNLEGDILHVLNSHYDASATALGLKGWLTSGSTLLFLDGFDEMAAKLDRVSIGDSLLALSRFSERHKAKLILTCRTHFFKTEIEESALKGMLRLYMCDWGAPELREYVKKSLPRTAESSLRRIKKTYDLEGLAKTPIFLNMIAATLGDLKGSINQAKLYQLYTDRWIQSQDYRSKLSPDQKQKFMEDLAYELYTRSMPRISYELLPQRLREILGVRDHEALLGFDADIRTCSFLIRDDKGTYYFVHKSFMEFFVALRLAKYVKENKLDAFAVCTFSVEVAGFFANFFENDWMLLVRLLLSGTSPATRANCAAALGFLPRQKPIVDALGLALDTEQEVSVRQRVVDALSGIGGEEATKILLRHADKEDDFGIYCLRSLRNALEDPSVATIHRQLLLSGKPTRRASAALGNIAAQAVIAFRTELSGFLSQSWWRSDSLVVSSLLGAIQALADLDLALNASRFFNDFTLSGENSDYALQVQGELRLRFRGRIEEAALANKRDGHAYARNAALIRERFGYLVDESHLTGMLKALYPTTLGRKKRSSRGKKG